MLSWCALQLLVTWALVRQVRAFVLEDLHVYRAPDAGDRIPIRLGYLTGSQQHVGDMYYRKPGQAISGAITKAMDEVNADPEILPNHVLEFVIAETYGQETDSIRLTAELPHSNISAYIGPQETCIHEGRIAASFNLPMISYVSTRTLILLAFCPVVTGSCITTAI